MYHKNLIQELFIREYKLHVSANGKSQSSSEFLKIKNE